MFGDAELPHRSVRIALGAAGLDGEILSPLELERLRPSPPPVTHDTPDPSPAGVGEEVEPAEAAQ